MRNFVKLAPSGYGQNSVTKLKIGHDKSGKIFESVPLIRVEFSLNIIFHKRQESFDPGVTLIKVGREGR
jgi:hypothetical protein